MFIICLVCRGMQTYYLNKYTTVKILDQEKNKQTKKPSKVQLKSSMLIDGC